ncbi:MAG: nickel-dependent lactate racemase [Chloroflexota bacterium]
MKFASTHVKIRGMQITLSTGLTQQIEFNIPDEKLGAVLRPLSVTPPASPQTIIEQAIKAPIGTQKLSQLVTPEQTVALLIDDVSRVTPGHIILPLLLAELHEVGIPNEQIVIVMALGTHRPMTQKEIVQKVGPSIAQNYTIINESCDDVPLVYMGESGNGIPAYINQSAAKADVRVGIGQIVPHMDAGFSGGAKIILPGVSGRQTVESFHAQEADIHENLVGNLNSPLRRDLEQFVADCVGLDFIVNIIPTREEDIFACVAGDFIEAHRAGVAIARDVYGIPTDRKYPIVLANSYPKDIDMWQTANAIWGGELILEEGGTLIVLSDARDRHSAYANYPQRIGMDPDQLYQQYKSGELDDLMTAIFAICIGRFKKRFEICLVSNGLTAVDAAEMGFTYFETVEQALAYAYQKHPQPQGTAVLTHAGVSFPYLKS